MARITYVTGKGGVGKTTVATALGLLAAQRGQRALVAELGADGHLARLFDKDITHVPRPIMGSLEAANFSVSEGLTTTLSSFVPMERIVRAVVNNRVLQLFMETAPSIREAVLLDALGAAQARYDRVLVDLPASGHAVTMLNTPAMITRLVKRGPIAKKADDLAAQILTPAEVLLVALPEALSVQETIELCAKLRANGTVKLAGIVLNQLISSPMSEADWAELERIDAAHPLHAQAVYLRDATTREELAAKTLEAETGLPVVRAPQVASSATPLEIAVALGSAMLSL